MELGVMTKTIYRSNLKERKNLFISIVRSYLYKNKIEFNEYEAESGSYYFHLNLNNNSSPCIRISDHAKSKNRSHCITMLYNIGLNTKDSKIKLKINKTLDKTINNSKRYSLYKSLENIK